jgi:hypothetical protein
MAEYFVSQVQAGAHDGSSVDNCSSIASFNAGDAPYNGLSDDTVYICDTITTAVAIPIGGTAGHIATIRGDYAGHPCIIANNSSNSIDINGKSFINVTGFSVASVSSTSPNRGVYIYNTCDSLNISNITMDLSGSAAAVRYGIQLAGAGTNIAISDITITGTSAAGNTVLLHGAGSGAISLSNIAGTGGAGFDIDNVAGLTMTNCCQASSTSYGFYLHDSVTGILTLSGLSCTGNTSIDFYLKSLTLGAGSTMSNCSTLNSKYCKFQTVSNLTVSNFVSDGSYITNPAVFIGSGSSFIIFNDCEVKNGLCDAWYIYEASGAATHDVTFNRCRAHDTGDKTNSGNGDGFTSHTDAYNLCYNNCLAYNMTGTAVAMVGRTAGAIYNMTAYNNGGAWSSEGGAKQNAVRATFYFVLTDVNPTTGTSWTVKDCIGQGGYPREVFLDNTSKALVTMDYNDYYHPADANFATINGGTNNISWATYHATYEANSKYADPLFVSATDFHLRAGSPCIDAGTLIAGIDRDLDGNIVPRGLAPDMGCFESHYTDPTPTIMAGGFGMFNAKRGM